MYSCPVCSRGYKTFRNLIKHFAVHLNGKCPICGWEGKYLVHHLCQQSRNAYRLGKFDQHIILYGLTKSNRSKHGKEMWKKSRIIAEEKCRIGGVRD